MKRGLTNEEKDYIREMFRHPDDILGSISSYLSTYFRTKITIGDRIMDPNDFVPKHRVFIDGKSSNINISFELIADLQAYGFDAHVEVIELIVDVIYDETEHWKQDAIDECYKYCMKNIMKTLNHSVF